MENTGAFRYERKPFHSNLLKKEVNCGFLTPVGLQDPPSEALYFFHGGNGDDQQFVQAGAERAIEPALVQELARRRCQIVLPFIGTRFLQSPFAEYFLEELMPWAEDGSASARHICGLSMGGQVALNLFLQYPERFASVGTHFPTLIDFDFTDPAAVDAYCKRTAIDPQFMEILLSEFRRTYETRERQAPFDPIMQARTVDAAVLHSKKIYLDVGDKDGFGLSEGCTSFHQVLSDRGIEHEFHVVPGGEHDGAFLCARINHLLRSLLR